MRIIEGTPQEIMEYEKQKNNKDNVEFVDNLKKHNELNTNISTTFDEVKKMQIINSILKGRKYEDIRHEFGITTNTIANIKRELMKLNPSLNLIKRKDRFRTERKSDDTSNKKYFTANIQKFRFMNNRAKYLQNEKGLSRHLALKQAHEEWMKGKQDFVQVSYKKEAKPVELLKGVKVGLETQNTMLKHMTQSKTPMTLENLGQFLGITEQNWDAFIMDFMLNSYDISAMCGNDKNVYAIKNSGANGYKVIDYQ